MVRIPYFSSRKMLSVNIHLEGHASLVPLLESTLAVLLAPSG